VRLLNSPRFILNARGEKPEKRGEGGAKKHSIQCARAWQNLYQVKLKGCKREKGIRSDEFCRKRRNKREEEIIIILIGETCRGQTWGHNKSDWATALVTLTRVSPTENLPGRGKIGGKDSEVKKDSNNGGSNK